MKKIPLRDFFGAGAAAGGGAGSPAGATLTSAAGSCGESTPGSISDIQSVLLGRFGLGLCLGFGLGLRVGLGFRVGSGFGGGSAMLGALLVGERLDVARGQADLRLVRIDLDDARAHRVAG